MFMSNPSLRSGHSLKLCPGLQLQFSANELLSPVVIMFHRLIFHHFSLLRNTEEGIQILFFPNQTLKQLCIQ